jgi:hypothetical protein
MQKEPASCRMRRDGLRAKYNQFGGGKKWGLFVKLPDTSGMAVNVPAAAKCETNSMIGITVLAAFAEQKVEFTIGTVAQTPVKKNVRFAEKSKRLITLSEIMDGYVLVSYAVQKTQDIVHWSIRLPAYQELAKAPVNYVER